MSANLNQRQRRVLDLLRARTDRELYEGAGRDPGMGSGQFWVTYTADETYSPLSWAEVRQMEAAGLIKRMWPGCYVLAEQREGQ
jgi:hypothetical protein